MAGGDLTTQILSGGQAGLLALLMMLLLAAGAYILRQEKRNAERQKESDARINELTDMVIEMHNEALQVTVKSTEVITRLAEKIDAKAGH